MVPMVSVIIPVRNCKKYIHEALESILAQDFLNFEIIVVDDGSDDFDYKTLEALDHRIRVLQQAPMGVSHARNHGIEKSTGSLIAFLDADDVWLPGKLSAQVSHLISHPDTGVIFGKYIRWTAEYNGSFLPAKNQINYYKISNNIDKERSGWIYNKLLLGLLVGMNTAIVRRAILDAVGGFNESMTHGEDYDFWLRCSRVAKMDSLNSEVALYRIHSQSAMHKLTIADHLSTLLTIAEMRWGLANVDGTCITRQQFQRRKGEVHFMFGYSHFWHGNTDSARRAFKLSFRHRFLPMRSFIYWITASARQAFRITAR